ncbi:MAG: 30S ribosomal protein S16 [Bacteroidia bacterium]|nr:MAG: 30S ribosomal protein S16 [Bacteroidia bacterium]
MAVKIRLSRHGRKNRPFYHIVIADSRAPRDGRFIERIGSYNPMTDPATIDLDVDKALDWLRKGAQPTLTVRNILSYKGVYLKKHLMLGVAKGAFDEAEAERRFVAWLEEKQAKIDAKVQGLKSSKEEKERARLEAEAKINAERAEAVAKKQAEELAAKAAAEAPAAEAPAEEEAPAAEAEAPAADAPVGDAPAADAPVAEA